MAMVNDGSGFWFFFLFYQRAGGQPSTYASESVADGRQKEYRLVWLMMAGQKGEISEEP